MTNAAKDNPGWLVWNPEGQHPRVTHDRMDGAEREASRLARENPGHRFFVLAPVGVAFVERAPSVYRRLDPDDIPF